MDLLLIIIRSWLFGKIGYGVRKVYFFIIGRDKKTVKKKKRAVNEDDFGDEIIGFIVLIVFLALAQCLIR